MQSCGSGVEKAKKKKDLIDAVNSAISGTAGKIAEEAAKKLLDGKKKNEN